VDRKKGGGRGVGIIKKREIEIVVIIVVGRGVVGWCCEEALEVAEWCGGGAFA